MVNNFDWTSRLDAIGLLRDVGKHFSVNRMLDREAVAARLAGAGISYTEFSYQVLQANDYLHLHREYGCRLQTGGSDQWGNLTAGVDLIRRVTGEHVHALTTPLLIKSDGQKFGKTESGTIWIDPDRTSAYAFYQFWLNTDDADVSRSLRVLSFKGHAEIEALERATIERPHAREAQRALAAELTTLVHGGAATEAVVAASAALFGRGDLAESDPGTLTAALAETSTTVLDVRRCQGRRRPTRHVARPQWCRARDLRCASDDHRRRGISEQRPGHRPGCRGDVRGPVAWSLAGASPGEAESGGSGRRHIGRVTRRHIG